MTSLSRRGAENPNAKLTEADIPRIRQRLADGDTLKVIAAQFGVSFQTISKIKNNRRWFHLPRQS